MRDGDDMVLALIETSGESGERLGGAGGAVAAVLILIVGRTLNVAMGALSVVVHGVRLNTLEFSQHKGLEWSGFPYSPLRKKAQAD